MAVEKGEEDTGKGPLADDGMESDDFGSFSDASFENNSEEVEHGAVAQYLDELLPDCGEFSQPAIEPASLKQLLQDERPHVIYEQLVELRTVLQPFSWDKSHLKANLWHILRIPEKEKVDRKPMAEEAMDDSLYKQIMALLSDTNVHSGHMLRDQFKIKYTAPLTPMVVHAEEEKEQERAIPSLLAKPVDAVDNLTEYHDALCHAVDVVFSELQELKKRQTCLMTDKNTFENVITNLTGHTQRLYRDEVALYNKRIKKRNKFSWGAK